MTVMGLRHAEIINRTGQATACPRSRLDELKQWPETAKPGIYFLFEARLGDSKPMAYIGESENVSERLLTQDREKEFWNDVVIFTNKDDNLTKSHVKYLESRLTRLVKLADRYTLNNANTPTQSNLSRADREAMEEFLEDIRLVLGTLGYPILEPLLHTPESISVASLESPAVTTEKELIFTVHKLKAIGVQGDEGFVLKKGSTASKSHTDSLNPKMLKLKDQLISDGRFSDQGDHYLLTEDLLISSSSSAAALISGISRSGPQSWLNSDGKSLKELEDIAVE
ncbi:GIY-YIG nuclease family protein [Achromobacter xylosoxidans]|uniref:GIY-YIG nuclease family protein n=1 Tax=Alcaligenes xylosoxydans xylosoxydans TaxID=85698 RepID=UPI001F5FD905|nr:GIY-YIG nuclease family protein [Achromobacter xylosoxidans]